MELTIANKILVLMSALLALLGGAYLGVNIPAEPALGGLDATAQDLIGTRTGTSTAGVSFYGAMTVPSTTYRAFITGPVDNAVISLKTTEASSTSASIRMSLLASNDTGCNTASTTSNTLNVVLQKDINWYDASSYIANLAGGTSLSAGTSTITWAPTGPNQGRQIVLNNLVSQCLALEVSASSTSLYGQIKTKI